LSKPNPRLKSGAIDLSPPCGELRSRDTIEGFRTRGANEIIGQIASKGDFAILPTQRDAWMAKVDFVRHRLLGRTGSIFFEFTIPRMGGRIDVVLLIGSGVFVVEFKVGATSFGRAAFEQVWDYALDLKNFHEANHRLAIVPILVGMNVATRRSDVDATASAVYLSGNGPLVAVLREALTRDEVARQRSLGNRVRKGKVGESAKAFIQNVRHFRDDALIDQAPPAEHVAIFDEALRPWTRRQTDKR
jgi:hypothetical protein